MKHTLTPDEQARGNAMAHEEHDPPVYTDAARAFAAHPLRVEIAEAKAEAPHVPLFRGGWPD